jgi:hypothetical protein
MATPPTIRSVLTFSVISYLRPPKGLTVAAMEFDLIGDCVGIGESDVLGALLTT